MSPPGAILALFPALALAACSTPTHSSAPPAPPLISNPIFSGDIWCKSQADAKVLFQDGAIPTPCRGGTLWAFGDTFLGTANPPGSLTPPAKELRPNYDGALSATIAWLPTGQASLPPRLRYFAGPDGKAISPLANFPNEPAAKMRMWPTGGIQIGSRTYLYYSMIEVTEGKAPWNFRGIGGGLAVNDSGNPLAPFRRLTPNNSWRFPIEPIQIIPADGTLYLYEVRGEEPKGLLLGRVAPDKIEDPAAYEYFAGEHDGAPRWSTRRADAVIILRDAAGQVSITRNKSLDAYLVVTSSDFFHPNEIQFRTAPTPYGPFSEPTRLPIPEKAGKKTNLIYCAFQHPELSPKDGSKAVITYCRILDGDWELSNPECVTIDVAR